MFKSERQAKNKLKLLQPVAGSQKTQEDRRKKKQQPASRTDRKRARERETSFLRASHLSLSPSCLLLLLPPLFPPSFLSLELICPEAITSFLTPHLPPTHLCSNSDKRFQGSTVTISSAATRSSARTFSTTPVSVPLQPFREESWGWGGGAGERPESRSVDLIKQSYQQQPDQQAAERNTRYTPTTPHFSQRAHTETTNHTNPRPDCWSHTQTHMFTYTSTPTRAQADRVHISGDKVRKAGRVLRALVRGKLQLNTRGRHSCKRY